MKLFFSFSLIVFSFVIAAYDVGDGSDGTCDLAGGATTQITSGRKTYQCTSLSLNQSSNIFRGDNAGAGGSIIQIKVQGNVTVSAGAVIDISGANGTDGSTGAGTISGGAGGAGGSSGGSATTTNGNSGSGTGAGGGGVRVLYGNLPGAYGGGGGGASYKTVAATSASNGDDGNGTVASTAGSQGSVYSNESTFESSFAGGSGGGAGGAGQNSSATIYRGSSGGGGGGALMIIAGGSITVDGTLRSNGGNGGGSAGTSFSGAGGAGSGGSIWLMAQGSITVSASGTIEALGGTAGTNDSGLSGLGGDGGNGRIRLDDGDGVISNSGTISPAAYSTTFVPTSITSTTSLSRTYSSSISCARVSLDEKSSQDYLIGFLFGISLIIMLTKLKSKFQA